MHVDRRRELLGVSDLWEERVGRARQIICQLIAPPRLSFPFIVPAYINPISLVFLSDTDQDEARGTASRQKREEGQRLRELRGLVNDDERKTWRYTRRKEGRRERKTREKRGTEW